MQQRVEVNIGMLCCILFVAGFVVKVCNFESEGIKMNIMNESLNIAAIKALYPNEWVLIGNPEMDNTELNVLAGIPVLHSKDKKEVCYLGKSKTADFNTITIIYTGNFKAVRAMTGIF